MVKIRTAEKLKRREDNNRKIPQTHASHSPSPDPSFDYCFYLDSKTNLIRSAAQVCTGVPAASVPSLGSSIPASDRTPRSQSSTIPGESN